MVIDVADKIKETIYEIKDRAWDIEFEGTAKGVDTIALAKLKKACMQYLSYNLIKALDEDI